MSTDKKYERVEGATWADIRKGWQFDKAVNHCGKWEVSHRVNALEDDYTNSARDDCTHLLAAYRPVEPKWKPGDLAWYTDPDGRRQFALTDTDGDFLLQAGSFDYRGCVTNITPAVAVPRKEWEDLVSEMRDGDVGGVLEGTRLIIARTRELNAEVES